jgi:hypothetical protein
MVKYVTVDTNGFGLIGLAETARDYTLLFTFSHMHQCL